MDWADKIASNIIKRGDYCQDNHFAIYTGYRDVKEIAQHLREKVKKCMEENMRRFEQEYSCSNKDNKWTREQKADEEKRETIRLAKLEETYDSAEDLKYNYAQKGIKIEPCWFDYPAKIDKVRINFSPKVWVDVLNTEGEYLPACCADISRIREILNRTCLDNYFIETEKLWELTTLAKHHGFDKNEKDPISKLIALWETIKEDAKEGNSNWSTGTDDPKSAIEVLNKTSKTIIWNEIFSQSTNDPKQQFHYYAGRQRALATLMSAVRTLYFKMKELDAGPVSGWAIWRDDGEIAALDSGIAIFNKKNEAEEFCAIWNKQSQNSWDKDKSRKLKKRKNKPDNYVIKPTKISLENGIELIQEIEIETFKIKKKHKKRNFS